MTREGKTRLKSFLQTNPVNNIREDFCRKRISLVGKNGAGRYPELRGSIFDQLGWNRGSLYLALVPCYMQGMRAFLYV